MPRDPTSLSLRQMNRLRVIEMLYRRPGSSRTDLARWTGLSRATVSTLVEELGHAGVVEEHEAADTDRPRPTGRPPVLLSLVPGAAFAVGLDFGHQHLRVAICDLSGELVAEDWSPAEVDHAPTESLDLARELVLASLRGAGIAPDRLLGVGMGLAAPIYRATGDIAADGILPGWQGIRPAAEMQARLGVPVELENDANVGALGEKVFGAARGVDDLVYVRLSPASARGSILGGRPYRGCPRRRRRVRPRAGRSPTGRSAAAATAAAWRRSPARWRWPRCSGAARARRCRWPACSSSSQPATAGRAARWPTRARRRRARSSMLVNTLNPELVVVGGELAGAGRSSWIPSVRRSSATPWCPPPVRCASPQARWATAPRCSAPRR